MSIQIIYFVHGTTYDIAWPQLKKIVDNRLRACNYGENA